MFSSHRGLLCHLTPTGEAYYDTGGLCNKVVYIHMVDKLFQFKYSYQSGCLVRLPVHEAEPIPLKSVYIMGRVESDCLSSGANVS